MNQITIRGEVSDFPSVHPTQAEQSGILFGIMEQGNQDPFYIRVLIPPGQLAKQSAIISSGADVIVQGTIFGGIRTDDPPKIEAVEVVEV